MVVGIDVGLTGGLAALGTTLKTARCMPIIPGSRKGSRKGSKNELDIDEVVNWIRELAKTHAIRLVVIERQRSMPKQGVTSMFRLGEVYGALQGVVRALGLPMLKVQPKDWKDVVLRGTAKDKPAAIQHVRGRYPGIDMDVGKRKVIYHDGMADAVCIAEYGWGL